MTTSGIHIHTSYGKANTKADNPSTPPCLTCSDNTSKETNNNKKNTVSDKIKTSSKWFTYQL